MNFLNKDVTSKLFLFVIICFTSCRNAPDTTISKNNLLLSNISGTEFETESDIFSGKPEVGSSYNKLSNTYLPSCFKSIETITPTEVQESFITYNNDLNEEFMRNVLDLEFSAKIPIHEAITLNPKFVFSRDAAVTNLSHTSTYLAYANLGEKKLVPYTQNKLILKPQFRKYFDENGHLENSYEFIRLCGDEIINTHKLSSKLLVTTKLSFKSTDDKLSFETDLGISPSIAPGWSINVKIKNLDIQLRKRLRINFYAIQIGGQPERLLNAMESSSCSLDEIEECQKILDKLQNYLAFDYSQQLVPTLPERWNIEDISSLPYYLLDLYDEAGKKLNFDTISSPDILDKLDRIKTKGQISTLTEQHNYQAAKMMQEKKYLGTDEKETLNEITTTALENVQTLRRFGNDCYKDLNQCLKLNLENTFANLIKPYDTSLLAVNIGDLISKVYAYTESPSFFSTRVSENFVVLQPDLQEGIYSSYYIKFKNLNNYVIRNDTISVDIKCFGSFFFNNILMKNAFQYYEILNPQMAINYRSKCNNANPLFVASPHGFAELLAPDTQFIVELWGRK